MALATDPSVPDLVAKVRTGSPDALADLYAAHSAALYRLAYRLLGTREEAEDVVHDLFVGLPEALRRYEERGSLLAWLKRVTVRLVLMRRRAATRRREVSIDTAESAPTRSVAEYSDLQSAVSALPDSLRTVLVLKEMEGYSHGEVAELLGITAGASRARLTRALQQLRRQLGASQ